jgi:hypothetical protein
MKKILLFVTLLTCCLTTKAQTIVGADYGILMEPIWKTDRNVLDQTGYFTSLNIDFKQRKRLGWNLGFEFSERKEYPINRGWWCGTGLDPFILDHMTSGYYVQRYGMKMGGFVVPVQRQKWVWKVGMGAHYFIESDRKPIPKDVLTEIKDHYNLRLVLKNVIQYQVANKIYLNLNQSYESYDVLSLDTYRLQLAAGIGYKI